MRIALGVEYDGQGFHGWQSQEGTRTVQSELERAVSKIADHSVRLHCAGRTDAGVHAAFQVVHFDSEANRSSRSWVLGTNSRLPPDINVLWAREVSQSFHARFSAVRRAYDYLILNRPTRSSLWAGKVTWECLPLDLERMRVAARYWLGEHDFSEIRASGCQARHPVRTVYLFDVGRSGNLFFLRVEANAFLQHMVRNFAGVLLQIGAGKQNPEWALDVLVGRRRELGGITAPPDGLYLAAVEYPEMFDLPRATRHSPMLPAYGGSGFQ